MNNTESTQQFAPKHQIDGFPYLDPSTYKGQRYSENLNTRVQHTLYNHIVDNLPVFGVNFQDFVRTMLEDFFAGELISANMISSLSGKDDSEECKNLRTELTQLRLLHELSKNEVERVTGFANDYKSELDKLKIDYSRLQEQLDQQHDATQVQHGATEVQQTATQVQHGATEVQQTATEVQQDSKNHYLGLAEAYFSDEIRQNSSQLLSDEPAPVNNDYFSISLQQENSRLSQRLKQSNIDKEILLKENEELQQDKATLSNSLKNALNAIENASTIADGKTIVDKQSLLDFQLALDNSVRKSEALYIENKDLKIKVAELKTDLDNKTPFDEEFLLPALKRMAKDIAEGSRSIFYSISENAVLLLFLKYYKIEVDNAQTRFA